LMRGKQILTELFPSLEKDLLENGAHRLDLMSDVRYHLATGWAMNFPSNMNTLACSRQLLEYVIRNEIITKYSNIEFVDNTKVTGLLFEKDPEEMKKRIVGIRMVSGYSDAPKNVYAKLTVDATGRKSELPHWLEELGLERPRETVVNSFIGYSTRLFKSTGPALGKAMIVFTKPPDNPRMGLIYPVEGDQWMVGLLGIGRNYPPVNEDEFLGFLKSLAVSEMYSEVINAKPTGPIFGYREFGSRHYHYEKMKDWPDGLVAFGDSVTAFNPIYGQGITVAALGANFLDKKLDDFCKKNGPSMNGFARTFQKRVAKVNAFPWLLGTSEDFRWSTTEGTKPSLFTRFIQKYSYQVMLLAPKSRTATKLFFEMINMLKPPLILFHPLLVGLITSRIVKSILLRIVPKIELDNKYKIVVHST
jgi:flavin-dependent dehydrogenase